MKTNHILSALMVWIVMTSPLFAAPPKLLQYSSAEYQMNFSTPGSTPAPKVDWGGPQGTFELASVNNGITIHPKSGVVSWKKNIPLGKNTVKVIARNSTGQASTEFVINHIFEGTFRGGFTNDLRVTEITDTTFVINFTSLYKILVTNKSNKASGNWYVPIDINKKISGIYSYDGRGSYVFDCTLQYTAEGIPILMGTWKAEKSTTWAGRFTLRYEEKTDDEKIKSAAIKTMRVLPQKNILTEPSPSNNSSGTSSETNSDGPSNFSYSTVEVSKADFFSTGSSRNRPVINWGKEKGTFRVAGNYPGIQIDPNLGVISWDKNLPLGDNIIEVIAENKFGKASAKVNECTTVL